jgi:hypothetical protein
VAQVDQVTNSPLALSRESRRWHRSRVARLPLPWAAASLTRGFGALVEVPGIAPTPTRLDTTSTRRSALLATPAGGASAWLLSCKRSAPHKAMPKAHPNDIRWRVV